MKDLSTKRSSSTLDVYCLGKDVPMSAEVEKTIIPDFALTNQLTPQEIKLIFSIAESCASPTTCANPHDKISF